MRLHKLCYAFLGFVHCRPYLILVCAHPPSVSLSYHSYRVIITINHHLNSSSFHEFQPRSRRGCEACANERLMEGANRGNKSKRSGDYEKLQRLRGDFGLRSRGSTRVVGPVKHNHFPLLIRILLPFSPSFFLDIHLSLNQARKPQKMFKVILKKYHPTIKIT